MLILSGPDSTYAGCKLLQYYTYLGQEINWLRNNYVKINTFIEKGKKSQNKKKHKHNQEKTGFELKLEINSE